MPVVQKYQGATPSCPSPPAHTPMCKVTSSKDIEGKLVEAFCLISEESYSSGSHDTGDPSTTNLYIGNINPTVRLNLNACPFIYMYFVVVEVLSNVYHEASIDQSAVCLMDYTVWNK